MAAAPPRSATVAAAIHTVQLALLTTPVSTPARLAAAGALLSRPDFLDVAEERAIAGRCGHPGCPNSLPPKPSRAPQFRVSLREHRVYDVAQSYNYCSQSCLVDAQAFAAALPEDRLVDAAPERVQRVLALFGGGGGTAADVGTGLPKLTITEKETGSGVVGFGDWVGPADAVEGYVSKRSGVAQGHAKSVDVNADHEMDVDVSKQIAKQLEEIVISEDKTRTHRVSPQGSRTQRAERTKSNTSRRVDFESSIVVGGHVNAPPANTSLLLVQDYPKQSVGGSEDGVQSEKRKPHKKAVHKEPEDSGYSGKKIESKESALKSSLKTSGSSKAGSQSVKWADKRASDNVEENMDGLQISDSSEVLNKRDDEDLLRVASAEACAAALIQVAEAVVSGDFISDSSEVLNKRDDEDLLRVASAEACAAALIQAAEAVVSGDSEAGEAVSDAGIVILPPSQYGKDGDSEADEKILELDSGVSKWPNKPVLLDTDMFEVEDSWHDTPPEGFNLNLSPFATMWMSLFSWTTCSSLAHIYGHIENSAEEYLSVNGRNYPHKIVSREGKSSEIRRTLDGYICRALPSLVRDLGLLTPVSNLEKAVGRLLDTMTFVDALPSLRTKQWHVIVLLLIDALSVHRLPSLASHVTNKNMLLHKVLNPAKISGEEYESMKDLLLPLGRLPQFSMQSGV